MLYIVLILILILYFIMWCSIRVCADCDEEKDDINELFMTTDK